MKDLEIKLKETKAAALILGTFSDEKKKDMLEAIAIAIEEDKVALQEANKKDVESGKKAGRDTAYIDRLTVTARVFDLMVEQIRHISTLPDPVGKIIEERTLTNGVVLQKISVPIGVIGIIYESRPNVTTDAAALSLRSGNAVVLKGSSSAINSNRVLVNSIHKGLKNVGVSTATVLFLDTTDRSVVDDLVKQDKYVDVIIPRGGYELVKKVQEASQVPVLYHAAGGARIYVDSSADLEQATSICVNAKVSRPAVCNSLDTVVVHKDIAEKFLPMLIDALSSHEVKLYGDRGSRKIVDMEEANDEIYATEFMGLSLAVKIVDDVKEAVAFVERFTKRHSEGVVSEDKNVTEYFVRNVDAAAVFVNCSTRFHDGGEFGLGAEMGVATGKIHARGPVGLKELTIYKWIAYGDGQIRE